MKQNWQIKKLGEVCEFIAGYTPKANEISKSGNVPYFKVSDMNRVGNEWFMSETELYVTEPKKIVPKDSIVFPKNGGALFTNKKRIIAQNSVIDLNSEALVHKDCIDVHFLYYFFLSIDLKDYSKGAALPTLDISAMKAIPIPIPPLADQHRIVDILDAKFAQIDALKAAAQKNLDNAEQLWKAQLEKQFDNQKWEKKKLGDVFNMVRGPFGGSLKKECFKESGYPVYEQQCAIHSNYNFRYFIDEQKYQEMIRFTVKPGDFVMSCSGVTMAMVSIVPANTQVGIINQALLKLSPKGNTNSFYLKYYLSADFFRNVLLDFAKGAAIPNMPGVKILKEITIPIPPLAEQERIVKELDALSAKINTLKANYRRQIECCDELRQSLLKKAFEGEL